MNSKKILLVLMCIIPLLGIKAEQKVKWQYSYGSSMGEVDTSTISKKVEFMYDKDGKLSRKVETSLLLDGKNTNFVLTNFGRYSYNDGNQLIGFDSFNYAADRLGVYHFSDAADYVTYEYNSAGQLAKETGVSTYYVYSYDAQGRLEKKETWKNTTYGWVLNTTETYSDFNSFDKPLKVNCHSDRASYNCWDGVYTYDAQGRKTSYLTYKEDGTLKGAEYWQYDSNGFLTEYQKKGISGGAEVNGSKTVYTNEGNGKTSQRSYSYSNGNWRFSGGSKKEEYTEDITAQTAPAVTAIQDNTGTGVTMTVSNARSGRQYRYYCNGLLKQTSSNLTYHVSSLEVGLYDFFVQDVETGAISNVATLDVEVDLPRPTNLKAVDARSDVNSQGETVYYVYLTWDAPQGTEGLNLTGYNVKHTTSYGIAATLNETPADPASTSYTVGFGIDYQFFILLEAVYTEGTSYSDTIWVDARELIGKQATSKLKMTRQESYLSVMQNPHNAKYYFYGQKDRIERTVNYSPSADSWSLYTDYTYNNLGQLVQTNNEVLTNTYEYNSKNQLVKTIGDTGYTTYEYDSDGNNTKMTVYVGEDASTTTYSDFQDKDKPRLEVKTYSFKTDVYRTVHVYDADDRQVCDSTFLSTDGGDFALQTVTTYELMTGDSYREKVYTQNWNSGTQSLDDYAMYDIRYYNEIDADSYSPTLQVVEGSKQDVLYIKSVDDALTRINVFCNGQEISHAVEYEGNDYDWDKELLVLKYDVSGSDAREYFVQYAKTDNSLNIAQENNISNIVKVNIPTGIEAVDNEQLTMNSYGMFNLAGQRVNGNTKGILIINGKKLVK